MPYSFNVFTGTLDYYKTGESGDIVVEGTLGKQLVQDNNSEMLLTGILKELKKMNLHMALLTDNFITNGEIE